MLKHSLIFAFLLSAAGCQSLTAPEPEKPQSPVQPAVKKDIHDPSGVVIHPYDHPDIERKRLEIPQEKQRVQQFDDGHDLPAFKKLMQQAQTAYGQGQLNTAEEAALHAQRLAPQAAETYLYLALIANRKNQPANAEALAHRGLSYAQNNAMKKQLWNVILKAAQKQNKTATAAKAMQELKAL